MPGFPSSRARRAALAAAAVVLLALAPVAAVAALAQEAPPEPPAAPGPGFPSPQAIAAALLAGLGEALTGWLSGPDLRGAIGATAGEFLEWGLRRVWDGLAWAVGGANVFTQLPPAWTTELPAVRYARERLAPKLRWYCDEADYAEVLWLVPAAGVEEPLWAAIAAVDPKAELVAVERLPAGLLRYAGG